MSAANVTAAARQVAPVRQVLDLLGIDVIAGTSVATAGKKAGKK